MTEEPTERELDLARRLAALEAKASRPTLAGGGVILGVINRIVAIVPKWLLTTGVVVLLVVQGFEYFNRAQQIAAETQNLEAEAAKAAVDADAQGRMIGDANLRATTLRAELAAAQADADQARAEAEAQKQIINGMPARLAALQAELEKTQAQALAARTEADAFNQDAGGEPAIVAQKRSEVESAETEVKQSLQYEWGAILNAACAHGNSELFSLRAKPRGPNCEAWDARVGVWKH